jgi:zinc protease
MKTRRTVLLILAAVVGMSLGAPGSALSQRVRHPDDLKFPSLEYSPPSADDFRVTLASGTPAFIAEDHEAPTFDLSVYVRTGILYEPAEKTGLAEMVAHLLRSGGTASRTAQELDERLEYLAATLSCRMGMGTASVTVSTLSKDMQEAVDILVEVLRTPAFSEVEIERYRTDRLQELGLRNNETEKVESREWAFLIYGDHPFARQFRETGTSVRSITADDLRRFHQTYFVPQNFVIAASGDFRREDLVRALERAFAGWSGTAPQLPEVPSVTHRPAPGVYLVNKEDVNQARVRLGHLGIRRDDPDFFSVSLMNYVLGGGDFASRIVQRVRSDEGLSYNQGSAFSLPVLHEGDFVAYFQTKPSTVAYGISIILEEIKRIREEPVDGQTLEDAKQNLRSMLVNNFVDPWTTMRTFAEDEITGRPKDFWRTYDARYQAVTAEDVQRAARTHLRPEEFVFLVVGDAEDVKNGTTEKSPARISDFGPLTELALPDPVTLER